MASEWKTLGTAVQIADIKNNKFHIDTLTINKIMDKVGDYSMAIISIIGPMKTGKSYILGHILRYLSASIEGEDDWFTKKPDKEFHWKSSADQQTTGIFMWSEPFFIERNAKKIAVLLIETGVFDCYSISLQRLLIFSLSCLLSSTLIYNIPRQISEDDLQSLHVSIEFAKQAEESIKPQLFSKLIFLIRDWQFPREFEYGYYDDTLSSGPRNFKREKLGTNYDMLSEFKLVRNEIKSSFQKVECFLMPYPGTSFAIRGEGENLEFDFFEAIKDFVPRIFDNAICLKNFGGEEMTGHKFKKFVQKWADYFAKAVIPEVANVTQEIAQAQNQIVYAIALQFYRNEMDKLISNQNILSEVKFKKEHEKMRNETLAIFQRAKRLKNDIQRRYFEKLEESVQEAYDFFKQMNYNLLKQQESKEGSEEMIEHLKKETKNVPKQEENFIVRIVNETESEISIDLDSFWIRIEYMCRVKPDKRIVHSTALSKTRSMLKRSISLMKNNNSK